MTSKPYNTSDRDATADEVNTHASGQLRFQVDAALLFQLGEQLVARRSVALAELIKNSYDADATRVTVTFKNVTKPNGIIIIEDNGSGMTFEDVDRAWMQIAYSDKPTDFRALG